MSDAMNATHRILQLLCLLGAVSCARDTDTCRRHFDCGDELRCVNERADTGSAVQTGKPRDAILTATFSGSRVRLTYRIGHDFSSIDGTLGSAGRVTVDEPSPSLSRIDVHRGDGGASTVRYETKTCLDPRCHTFEGAVVESVTLVCRSGGS